MRRGTVMAAAGSAVAVVGGFMLGWVLLLPETAAPEGKVADANLVTGTIPSRAVGAPDAPWPQSLQPLQAPRESRAMAPTAIPPGLPMQKRRDGGTIHVTLSLQEEKI